MEDKVIKVSGSKAIGDPKGPYWQKQYDLLFNCTKIQIDKDNPVVFGTGGFGLVVLGTLEQNNSKRQFAVKFIKLRELNEAITEKYNKLVCLSKNEFNVILNLRHKNVIHCHGVFELDDSRAIVMEIANKDIHLIMSILKHGDRDKSVSINCKNDMPDYENLKSYKPWYTLVGTSLTKYFMWQIVNVLEYMNKGLNYVHKDLKLNNILLGRNLTCKLADFNLTTKVEPYSQFLITDAGTVNYMGPEFYNKGLSRYIKAEDAFKIDYFSLGICIYKLLTGFWVIESDKIKGKPVEEKYTIVLACLDEVMKHLKIIKTEKENQRKSTEANLVNEENNEAIVNQNIKIENEENNIPSYLDDNQIIKKTPENSVSKDYLDYKLKFLREHLDEDACDLLESKIIS